MKSAEKLSPLLPILLVDDEEVWLQSIKLLLNRRGGYNNVRICNESTKVLSLLDEQEIGVVVLDYSMPGKTGEELLVSIKSEHPNLQVIILTAHEDVDLAVSCIKKGAFDYCTKASEPSRLFTSIHNACRISDLMSENASLNKGFTREFLQDQSAFSQIITRSGRMKRLLSYAETIASTSHPVLITGESGTGKDLLAHAIHAAARSYEPFVVVNAATLDDEGIMDTLFGHVRGFGGAENRRVGLVEQAGAGTIFIDEIACLSISAQQKLLRLIDNGEYTPLGAEKPKRSKARIMVATNEDLESKIQSGEFRKDLLFRLQIHHVHLPPLRDRLDDVGLLLEHFLSEAASEQGKRPPTPPPELYILLDNYRFPGNVRELRSMVYNAVSMHSSKKLSMASFKQAMGVLDDVPTLVKPLVNALPVVSFGETMPTMKEMKSLLIKEAARRAGGNQGIMANLLGMTRTALNKYLRRRDRETDE